MSVVTSQKRCPPDRIVIAHRGASGYLPEHTLPAKALAHAMGADYLEQDLVLTRDDVPIVLHDIHLDTVTDVAERFPARRRADGRFYAIDFDLEEIRQLQVSERFDPVTRQPVFAERFPVRTGSFRIPTLEEELALIQGLNQSRGMQTGIYPEIKQPAFHRQEGKEISPIVIAMLARHGYQTGDDHCFLQCFDSGELQRIRSGLSCRLRMIQLLETADLESDLPDAARLRARLAGIADYAQGIGPSLQLVFPQAVRETSPLVEAAHAAGLVVHPWTYRRDALPAGWGSFEDLHLASFRAGVDGLFSDFPDVSRELSCKASALFAPPAPVK